MGHPGVDDTTSRIHDFFLTTNAATDWTQCFSELCMPQMEDVMNAWWCATHTWMSHFIVDLLKQSVCIFSRGTGCVLEAIFRCSMAGLFPSHGLDSFSEDSSPLILLFDILLTFKRQWWVLTYPCMLHDKPHSTGIFCFYCLHCSLNWRRWASTSKFFLPGRYFLFR